MCGSKRPRASSECCRRGQILAEWKLGGGAESSGSVQDVVDIQGDPVEHEWMARPRKIF